MDISDILKMLAEAGILKLTEESIKIFVETKIKPIFLNWGKEESNYVKLEDCLSEYLFRCYAKNNIMTTIVFGKLQKTLEELYIPLTLEEFRDKHKEWAIDKKEWVINKNRCYDILEEYGKILIVDTAGMGKSTIVKYLACQGINLNKCIPIVIELRKLKKGQTILKYIQTQINSFENCIEIEDIIKILKRGDFVIFFDGYDEISNENKPYVLDELQNFISRAVETKIVITSRDDDDINSLGMFKCVNIKPLNTLEAYSLILKYDNSGEVSEKLIDKLSGDISMNVLTDFLKNPLLVSLLYKTFEYKEDIPYKKVGFYSQVYEALFNDHDKTKGAAYVHEKKTQLDKYQFEQILRTFGFLALKTDKVEYSSQLIYQLIDISLKRFGWLKVTADDFLSDIMQAIPFIQKDGNEYKWIHKSFMEYFASCFICFEKKEIEQDSFEKMISIDSGAKYYNVLDFCYELDTLSFRKFAIFPYINRYVQKYGDYFTDPYFKQFDPVYLDIARSWLALNKKILIFYSKTELLYSEINNYIERTGGKSSNIVSLRYNTAIVILYTVLDSILINKMSYLATNFKTFSIGKSIIDRIVSKLQIIAKDSTNQYEVYEINENIDNPINQDKELFSHIISCTLNSFSDENTIYDLQKCKALVDEIKLENDNFSNDFFSF